jgi:hypothetical protein
MNNSTCTEFCQPQTTVILPPPEIEKIDRATLSPRLGTIYRASGHLFIIRETAKCIPKQFIGTVRNSIIEFSAGSAMRMRRYLRECAPNYRFMVTLTYPGFYESNGTIVKQHLKRFLQELRRRYIRLHSDDGLHSSFWFLEFQSRGAPHFHIFTTWSGDKDWTARTWYRIVDSEDNRHLVAGTRVETIRAGRKGTISYASKYAAKAEQKEVPENYKNVGRFWGITGRRCCLSADTFVQASEAGSPDVKPALNRMFKLIEKLLLESLAEIIVRDQGILVLNVHDFKWQQRMRVEVSRLALQTCRWHDLFIDAELDYGEGLMV